MRFDFGSSLIGFIVGVVLSAIVYRFRNQIAKLRGSIEGQATSTTKFLRTSAETRYIEEVVKYANRYHLAGDQIELSEIYVEPHFIQAIKPVDLDPNANVGSVFHVVPMVHQFPAIYAAYNIPTLSIIDLRAGDRHLAVLGLPGQGKSTALAVMALYAARAIELESLDNLAEQVQAEEDKDLSPQEREERAKTRKEQQERALAQLRVSQEREQAAKAKQKVEVREAKDYTKLLPLLVHIRDIDLTLEGYGGKKSLDPAEPLVKAIMHRFGGIAAQTIPRAIYGKLNTGGCMVLIDGFDEIGYDAWPEKLAWLERFKADYGGNVIVVTGPVEGFDSLVNVGFTPLYIRPFSDPDQNELIEKWAKAWPIIAGSRRKPAPAPDEKLVKRVATANRGRSAMDVTLKAWAAFADDEKEQGRHGWYDFYVRHALEAETQRPGLAAFAAKLLDDGVGYSDKAGLKAISAPGGDGKATLADVVEKALGKAKLIVDAPGNAVAFRHPLFAAFLAAEDLKEASRERIAHVATLPAWRDAMAFAAAITNIEAAVLGRLNMSPDLLFNNNFEIAWWLAEAPAEANWRGDIFRRLGAALGGPSQYPGVRERAAAALVTTHDKGIQFVFKQALKSPDAKVRALGCVALGAIGDPEVIKDIGPLLADGDPDVTLAAGLALGAMNSETAIETMMAGLFEGEEGLRRAVAETLAALPDGGQQILRETIRSNDMLVRRATVFGLARVKAPWALALLYRALLEDPQWYVRSAAEQAFAEAETTEGDGPIAHPDADVLIWLIEWAASRGEGVPNGPNARQVLIKALQEGDTVYRAAAAITIAYLGYAPGLKPLYNALRDKEEVVRGTAYEALGLLQQRLGKPLPAVV
jgi:hypothetical protein